MGAQMATDPISLQQLRNASEDAQDLEHYVNDDVPALIQTRIGGQKPNYVKFLADRDEQFQQFLLSSGYQEIGDYAAGLQITARNQIFRKDGEFYRASASLDLPYTTTGDWNSEGESFVSVGDAALRQELVNTSGSGAALVGWIQAGVGAIYRTVLDKVRGRVDVKDFGAIGDGTYHPLSERFATLEAAQAQYPHVTSLSQSIDWAALMAAMRTGKTVEDDGLHLIVTDVWYPTRAGQQFRGAGDGVTIIENPVNDDPLFCFGNPMDPNGAAPWSSVSGFALKGRVGGNTIWGAFCPNAPTLAGNPYAPGQVEGMSNDPSNVYYGRLPFTPAEWNTAARGCRMSDVTITNVYGGHALHVSAWAFIADNVKLFSGKQGLRNSGSANSNRFSDLYISSMSMEGLLHPNTDGSIPTATSYINCIVQQCGADATGRGSIALLKGQGTQIDALYLERNNERGSPADIFASSSEIGLRINSLRHTTDNETPLPVIIHTEGSGAFIGSVVFGKNVSKVIHITGTDTRTETRVEGPIRPVGSNTAVDGVLVDDSTGKRTSAFLPEVAGVMGLWLDGWTRLYKAPGKRAFRQSVSTATEIALESHGSVRIVLDAGNNSGGQGLYIDHNGIDGAGTNLVTLSASNGSFAPGAAGTQSLGTPTMPWNIAYLVGGVVNPSDLRKKQQVREVSEAEARVASAIRVRAYKLNQEVDRLGAAAPIRYGVIAQEVIEAFRSEGLDALAYGMVEHESWAEIPEQRNAGGAVIRPYRPAGDTFLVNYGELAAFMLSAQQGLLARVAALEARQ